MADGDLEVHVADGGMAVFVSGCVSLENLDSQIAHVRSQLALLVPSCELSEDALRHLLEEAAKDDPHLTDTVLLRGSPPIAPQDGRIEWAKEFFAQGFVLEPETDTVDFRHRAEQLDVSEGERLARLLPPKEGQAGQDVFGKSVPTTKPKRATLRAGDGVRHEEEEDTFWATVNGRVRHSNGTLTVDDVYDVPGNVALESGDIFHPGALIVEQNICAGATVRADGDIDVKGEVEDANVEAGGSLTIHGGLTSRADHHIVVGGGLHAKFILQADVEADGDIVVEKEIEHATLKARGSLLLAQGRVTGGEVVALGGIDVAESGSEASTRTVLAAGEDFRLDGLLAARKVQIAKARKNIKRLRRSVDPLEAREAALSPENQSILTKLRRKVAEDEGAVRDWQREMEKLKSDSQALAKLEIVVRGTVHAETVFRIAGKQYHVEHSIAGPVQVTLNHEGEMRLEASQSTDSE